MNKTEHDHQKLYLEMEHVMKDAEHFLSDLKGQKHVKGKFTKDIVHLTEHLHGLIELLAQLEKEHVQSSTGAG